MASFYPRKSSSDKILECLQLSSFTEQKNLSLEDVQTRASGQVFPSSVRTCRQAFEFVQQILMLNSNAFINVFQSDQKQRPSRRERRRFENLLKVNSQPDELKQIHPQDILVLVYQVSSPFLQAHFISKLYACKLAFPLMLPDTAHRSIVLFGLKNIILPVGEKRKSLASAWTHPMPIVSFVRLSDNLPISKSQSLNQIMFEGNVIHNTFYTRKCPRGNTVRKVSNGLVEGIIFQTPRGGVFSCSEIHLINVRGNASEKTYTKQIQYIAALSNVFVIFMMADDLGKNQFKTFYDMIKYETTPKLIIILSPGQKPFDLVINSCTNLFGGSLPDCIDVIFTHTESGNLRSTNDMISEIRMAIAESLSECNSAVFESVRDKLLSTPYVTLRDDIDLNTKMLTDSRSKLEKLKQELNITFSHQKRHLFSAYMIWHDAQLKRSTESEMVPAELRLSQLQSLSKYRSPGLQYFLHILGKYAQTEPESSQQLLIFIDLVKDYFDDVSRQHLHRLNQRYLELTDKLNNDYPTDQHFHVTLESLRQTERELLESSCGINHLFREVAQIYETMHVSMASKRDETCKQDHPVYSGWKDYPAIAARLLLSGMPLELMDGDARSIPMRWMKAVLQCLSEELRDAKVLVLSVLGVQSSGKSTLLNAMFGVQFAVSAGRCTRGVTMQLVKMGENCREETKLHFDYILLLDTEGIRALEGTEGGIKRDNEIATLVIGLSDLTIVNIKGEQYTDVQDVIQIAVHAFLRMHIRNYQRRCVFVHQNVPAADADEKLLPMKERLISSLNDATRDIASIENRQSIIDFRQIVHFDPERHLFYFGDIKLGDHPMAPTNPNYFDKVVRLKREILQCFVGCKDLKMISDINQHLENLWGALVSQEFVFQFRNCEDVEDYTRVENQIRTYYMELNSYVNTVCYSKAVETFRGCHNKPTLDSCCQFLVEKFTEKIKTKAAMHEHSLFYLKSSRLVLPRHRMRGQGATPMQQEIATIINRMETKINILKDKRNHEIQSMKIDRSQKDRLRELTKNMITSNVDTTNKAEIEKAFQPVWSEWLKEAPQLPTPTINVVEEVIDYLIKFFPLHAEQVQQCMDEFNIREHIMKNLSPANLKDLHNYITIDSATHTKYIHITSDTPFEELTGHNSPTSQMHALLRTFQPIIKTIKRDKRFSEARVFELLKECRTYLETFNGYEMGYEFTREFEYTVDIYVMGLIVIPIFKKIERKFEEDESCYPSTSQCYQKMLRIFSDILRTSKIDLDEASTGLAHSKAVDEFRQQVQQIVSGEVKRDIWTNILKLVCTKFNDKTKLINLVHTAFLDGTYTNLQYMNILQGTLKEECLNEIYRWIEYHIFSRMQSRTFWNTIQEALNERIAVIQRCLIIDHQNSKSGAEAHIERINRKLKKLNITLDFSTTPQKDIKDIVRDLKEALHSVYDSLMKEITVITYDQIPSNDVEMHHVLKYLWGCDQTCMICNEPCVLMANHLYEESKPHWCPVHRPAALASLIKRREYGRYSIHFSIDKELWCSSDLKRNKTFGNWRFGPADTLDGYWAWFLSQNYGDLRGVIDHQLISQIQCTYGTVTPGEARAALNKRSQIVYND